MGNKSTKDNLYDNTFAQPQQTLEQIRQPALEAIENCFKVADTYMKTANKIKTLIDTSELTEKQKKRICFHHVGMKNIDENVTSCQGMISDENIFKLSSSKQHTLQFLKKRLIDTCDEDKLITYTKLPEYTSFIIKFTESLIEKLETTKTLVSLMKSYNDITMNHMLTKTQPQTLEDSYAVIFYDDYDGQSYFRPTIFRIEPTIELVELYKNIEKVFYGDYHNYRMVPLTGMYQNDFDIESYSLEEESDEESDKSPDSKSDVETDT